MCPILTWGFRISFFFFFNDTATTEIYTLSLHDALPISVRARRALREPTLFSESPSPAVRRGRRSEEHTSELQSQSNLVCRLLLEKKKKKEHTRVQRQSTLHTSTEPNYQTPRVVAALPKL